MHLLRSGDGLARCATGVLAGLCADDSRAAAALAVPFLIPIATDDHHAHRAAALAVLSAPARAWHVGIASREEFLLHRADPQRDAPDDYDGYGVEVTGYPAGWSVAAARAAITAATPALLPLLHDADPTIRIDASYALATAADPDHTVRTVLAARCATEQDVLARAALLLAIAEITRAHPHPPTLSWLGERWHDPTEAGEVRLAAAIGWLCLTDEPAPQDLHQTIDVLATDERAYALAALPWMDAAAPDLVSSDFDAAFAACSTPTSPNQVKIPFPFRCERPASTPAAAPPILNGRRFPKASRARTAPVPGRWAVAGPLAGGGGPSS
ncbi:hypothetical protein [Streptomyces sp. NPDC001759]